MKKLNFLGSGSGMVETARRSRASPLGGDLNVPIEKSDASLAQFGTETKYAFLLG